MLVINKMAQTTESYLRLTVLQQLNRPNSHVWPETE